jgi:polyhydroxyalkanoate synthase subunit PhaC
VPLLPVLAAVALLVVVGAAASTEYARLVRSTRRRQLAAGPVVQAWRFGRSLLARAYLILASWPYLVSVVAGLRRAPTGQSPADVVWQSGRVQLLRYREGSRARSGPPVLLVHSLVTRPWVLDLAPGRSLVQCLVDAGHDVFLLDWGLPGIEDASHGLEHHARALWEAEHEVARLTRSTAIDEIGYCMGGTLALALHSAAGPGPVRSLAVLAAPVDTAAVGGIGRFLGSRNVTPGLLLDHDAMVPGAFVREAFHALRPEAVRRAKATWRTRKDPLARAYGGALGRWAFTHPSMPGALLFDLVDLYRGNQLLAGQLALGGRPVPLTRLAGLPLLVVTTVRDHIVPPASSLALCSVTGLEISTLQCTAGHVAMLAGSEGERVLYPGLLDWLGTPR